MGEALVRRFIREWVEKSITAANLEVVIDAFSRILHRLVKDLPYGNQLLTMLEDKVNKEAIAQELAKSLLELLAPVLAKTMPEHAAIEHVRVSDLYDALATILLEQDAKRNARQAAHTTAV
jgi:hypothetical protein